MMSGVSNLACLECTCGIRLHAIESWRDSACQVTFVDCCGARWAVTLLSDCLNGYKACMQAIAAVINVRHEVMLFASGLQMQDVTDYLVNCCRHHSVC